MLLFTYKETAAGNIDCVSPVLFTSFFAGEEPCYAGVPMSTIVERGYGVGDVISLLWFKRSLPRYCTQFVEVTCF